MSTGHEELSAPAPRHLSDIQPRIDELQNSVREQARRPGFKPTPMTDLHEEEELADMTEALFAEQLAARLASKRAASQPPVSPSENH